VFDTLKKVTTLRFAFYLWLCAAVGYSHCHLKKDMQEYGIVINLYKKEMVKQ